MIHLIVYKKSTHHIFGSGDWQAIIDLAAASVSELLAAGWKEWEFVTQAEWKRRYP